MMAVLREHKSALMIAHGNDLASETTDFLKYSVVWTAKLP